MMRLDPAIIKHQIETLLVSYPELADDDILRADMIEGSTDIVQFLRLLEARRQNACTLADAVAANIDNLRQRKDRFDRRDQGIRDLMLKMLQLANIKRMEMPEATISVRIGTPKVIVTDEAALPDEFCRIKREPDKAKLKAALSDFQSVPGAVLSNAEDGLAIRTR